MSNGLKGDQYKLDMNKDGKLTAEDFEEVRKSRRSGGLLSGDDFMVTMSEGGQFEERQPYVFGSLVRQLSKGVKSLMGKNKKTKEDRKALEEDLKRNPDPDYDTNEYGGLGHDSLSPNWDDYSLIEKSAEIQAQMSKDADKLRARGFSNERIEELLEEAYELNNPKELELALKKPIKKQKKYEGGLLESDDSRYGMNEGGEMEEMEEENEMLPDEEMEQNFIDFVVGEALSDEEKSMLEEQLEANPELSVVFDKVVEKASEFTGAGPVEGPGTGTSDDIPARLSDGEFVFTAKAVEQLGADNLMQMMKDAEAAYDEERVGYANGDYVQRLDGEQEVMDSDKKVTVEYNVNPAGKTNDSLLNRYDAGIMAEDETDRLVKSSMIEGKPYVRS